MQKKWRNGKAGPEKRRMRVEQKNSSWKLPNEIPWKMSIGIIWNSYGRVMSVQMKYLCWKRSSQLNVHISV